jgi:hypothetical protein
MCDAPFEEYCAILFPSLTSYSYIVTDSSDATNNDCGKAKEEPTERERERERGSMRFESEATEVIQTI